MVWASLLLAVPFKLRFSRCQLRPQAGGGWVRCGRLAGLRCSASASASASGRAGASRRAISLLSDAGSFSSSPRSPLPFLCEIVCSVAAIGSSILAPRPARLRLPLGRFPPSPWPALTFFVRNCTLCLWFCLSGPFSVGRPASSHRPHLTSLAREV